jgi:carbon storage regulator
MLILARRPGERVVIGGEIVVTVMEISGNIARLGIEAPRGVSIYREEIWLAVEEENRAAAAAAADALPLEPVGEIRSQPGGEAPQSGEEAPQPGGEAPSQPVGESSKQESE